MDLTRAIKNWVDKKTEERLRQQFGGIQRCPWCNQWAQDHGDWGFKAWDRDPMLDVLTCGPCGGTSLWRFEIGFLYIGPLAPPKPKHEPAPYYDIEKAALRKGPTQ